MFLNILMINIYCPDYLNEVFDVATESNVQLRGTFQKLKCSFRKTSNCQLPLSYVGSVFWNKTRETLKRTNILNFFKHNLKNYSLSEIENSNDSL